MNLTHNHILCIMSCAGGDAGERAGGKAGGAQITPGILYFPTAWVGDMLIPLLGKHFGLQVR